MMGMWVYDSVYLCVGIGGDGMKSSITTSSVSNMTLVVLVS